MNGIDKDDVMALALHAGALLADADKSLLFDLGMQYIQPGGIAIEVGSWRGGSAVLWGSICRHKGARLYCVDAFSSGVHEFGELDDTDRLLAFVTQTHGLPVTIITGDSAEVHKVLRDGIADLVFVDGDHHYEMAKSDFLNFGRKLRPGGVICGHDYNTDLTGVTEAAHELFGVERVKSVAHTFYCDDLRCFPRPQGDVL